MNQQVATQVGALCILLVTSLTGLGEVLLDDKFADGSRGEANRPAEAEVWVGREEDVRVAPGALSTQLGETSQKIWTYFTDSAPVTIGVGDKLIASVSFVPRKALSEGSSRSFRFGVFYDPTGPRVEDDVNSDGGGPEAPWTDAQGYAVQVLVAGGEFVRTSPFDLGKRVNLKSASLLGTSGDYFKQSGGRPVALELDKQYRVTLTVEKESDKEVELTAALDDGGKELASWSVTDDGGLLGDLPIYDKFDLLFIRIADNLTTADQIDFTNFKVELVQSAAN